MPYTGGELNWLNGRYGISAPERSVPVMKLIRTHRPKSRSELYELIRAHHDTECPCGIRSRGTVEDFGRRLYDAQMDAWGEHRYSLDVCIQWEYDLFVSQSLKGLDLEHRAVQALSDAVPGASVTLAHGFLDEELRVDLLVERDGRTIAGIQVKPMTFCRMRPEVKAFHRRANARWGRPVYYLFYDGQDRWVNLKQILRRLSE